MTVSQTEQHHAALIGFVFLWIQIFLLLMRHNRKLKTQFQLYYAAEYMAAFENKLALFLLTLILH